MASGDSIGAVGIATDDDGLTLRAALLAQPVRFGSIDPVGNDHYSHLISCSHRHDLLEASGCALAW